MSPLHSSPLLGSARSDVYLNVAPSTGRGGSEGEGQQQQQVQQQVQQQPLRIRAIAPASPDSPLQQQQGGEVGAFDAISFPVGAGVPGPMASQPPPPAPPTLVNFGGFTASLSETTGQNLMGTGGARMNAPLPPTDNPMRAMQMARMAKLQAKGAEQKGGKR